MLDNLTSYLSSSLGRKLQYSANQENDLFSQLSMANILQKHNKSDFNAKSQVTFRSTPNLADISDSVCCNISKEKLYKNKSTECLANATDHLKNFLFNAYQKSSVIKNFASENGESEVPSELLYAQLKKLEDIYKYLNSENTHEVTIRKDSRGFGFSICGGRDSSEVDPLSQLIRVSKLYPLQPALASGNLFVDDILLEVNGTNMVGLTNTEALEMLRSSDTDITLKVFRPSAHSFPSLSLCKDFWPVALTSSVSETCFHEKTSEDEYVLEEFEIILVKQDGVLGFTVCKREDCKLKGFYVLDLIREPALSDGRIRPGDFIWKVNGTCISAFTMEESLLFLRDCSPIVSLTLIRPNPPGSPLSLDGETSLGKPLRWEAIELLNDRMKQKDNGKSAMPYAKKNLRRKYNSEDVSREDCADISSFHAKETMSEDTRDFEFEAVCAKDLLSLDSSEGDQETKESTSSEREENSKVLIFELWLYKGWYTRLGFSLCDPACDQSGVLPLCPEVKAVYPGSLAAKDGRIQAKDRLLEVNSVSLCGIPALNAIDILRRTAGRINMRFCRLEKDVSN